MHGESTEPWVERVRFALLDGEGRLASAPVDVTPPNAAAVSPFFVRPDGTIDPLGVTSFRTSTWVEDDGSVLVSYASVSREHTGLYLRRIRCGGRE